MLWLFTHPRSPRVAHTWAPESSLFQPKQDTESDMWRGWRDSIPSCLCKCWCWGLRTRSELSLCLDITTKKKKKTHIKGSLYRYLFWSSILYSIYLDANSLFVKKAYVEMECTLTMEIYIVKYIWLLCRYFWEYFKLPTPSQTHKCITMRC